MKDTLLAVTTALVLIAIDSAHAQTPSFAPAKGQSSEQQASDVAACRTIAVQQSGFDPAHAQPAAPPPARGARARGAARGAAVGAAAGAIGDDAGKGAAAGATAGTVA